MSDWTFADLVALRNIEAGIKLESWQFDLLAKCFPEPPDA